MSWRDDVARVSQIVDREYMRPQQAIAIGELWERLKPRRIVEVGTYKGTGACYLGVMAACYGGHVWTVDLPWTGAPNKHFTRGAEHVLAECGVTNVTVVRREDGSEGFFRDHFRGADTPLDFVYIDGGHTWLNTTAQYAMACAALQSGGWLCFDDITNPTYPEVGLVWRHLVTPRHGTYYVSGPLGFAQRE